MEFEMIKFNYILNILLYKTPFFYAIKKGNIETITVLLSSKSIDVNIKSIQMKSIQ